MTNRTWTNNGTDSFNDPTAWTPNGAPESGDVLTIAEGSPDATDLTLQGLTIGLGANTGISEPPFGPLGNLPSPVLTLNGSTIGAGTTIVLPAVFRPILLPAVINPLIRWPYPAVDQGTIFVTGASNDTGALTVSTNDGTIETAASNLFAAAGTLTLDIGGYGNGDAPPGDGLLENNGVIDASRGSTILLEGLYSNAVDFSPGGHMNNDDTINVSGTVNDVNVDIDGIGTINLDSSPGYLGLAASPGKFIVSDSTNAPPSIGSGQNFVFNGGELVLTPESPYYFDGALSNFGSTPGNTIELQDFTLSSASYSAGVLTLNGVETKTGGTDPITVSNPVTDTLKFSSLPRLGHFVFNESAGNTDITWNSLPFLHRPV